jgi:peptidoglycan/xylan/chitin deacetylase (PgdA/CDA1 family)
VLRGSIRSVEPADPESRLVALTFDLCEQAREQTGYDGRIVDWLRGHRIPATFFAGGEWLRTHSERAMQLMADPLFELGNHGWTHANLRVADAETAREQLVWTQAEYQVLRQELYARPCVAVAG